MFLPERRSFQPGPKRVEGEFRQVAFGLFQRPRHSGPGSLACLSQLSQAQAVGPVAEQTWSINLPFLLAPAIAGQNATDLTPVRRATTAPQGDPAPESAEKGSSFPRF